MGWGEFGEPAFPNPPEASRTNKEPTLNIADAVSKLPCETTCSNDWVSKSGAAAVQKRRQKLWLRNTNPFRSQAGRQCSFHGYLRGTHGRKETDRQTGERDTIHTDGETERDEGQVYEKKGQMQVAGWSCNRTDAQRHLFLGVLKPSSMFAGKMLRENDLGAKPKKEEHQRTNGAQLLSIIQRRILRKSLPSFHSTTLLSSHTLHCAAPDDREIYATTLRSDQGRIQIPQKNSSSFVRPGRKTCFVHTRILTMKVDCLTPSGLKVLVF